MKDRNRRTSRQCLDKQSSFQVSGHLPASLAPDKSHGDNTPRKQRLGRTGTAVAIKDIDFSGASSPARRWGGRRNSASRTSDSLSLSQAANIIDAARFAAAIGLPFNRHVTIHWEHAGIPDERAAWATGRFLKMAGDWLNKRKKTLAWAWVRENGDRKGSHVHMLLHLPVGTRTGDMQRRWLRSITGQPYRASTIKTARIGGTAGAAQTAPAAYRDNLATVVSYIVKGACPAAANELGLALLEAGGRIVGKRAATSQNIGREARERRTG